MRFVYQNICCILIFILFKCPPQFYLLNSFQPLVGIESESEYELEERTWGVEAKSERKREPERGSDRER